MSKRDSWYRHTSWTESDKKDFYENFERTRSKKTKYEALRIQAVLLHEAGIYLPALSLCETVEKDFAEYNYDAAQILVIKAECFYKIGDYSKSFKAYMDGIKVREASAYYHVRVVLSFAEHFWNYGNGVYKELLIGKLENELVRDGMPAIVSEAFRYGLVMARLLMLDDRAAEAQEWIKLALDAQSTDHSGFFRYPKLGLVKDTPEATEIWLRQNLSNKISDTTSSKIAKIIELKKQEAFEKAISNPHLESLRKLRLEAEAQEPLVLQALREVGVEAGSVWSLYGKKEKYIHALSTLAEHLRRPYSSELRADIARLLEIKESAPYWDVLVAAYKEPSTKESFALSNALAFAIITAVPRNRLSDLADLAKDPNLGETRLVLPLALKPLRNKDPFVADIIVKLCNDPEIAKVVKRWPRKKQASE